MAVEKLYQIHMYILGPVHTYVQSSDAKYLQNYLVYDEKQMTVMKLQIKIYQIERKGNDAICIYTQFIL